MGLIERIRALGSRREWEGIYTDNNICQEAIAEITRLRAERKEIADHLDEVHLFVTLGDLSGIRGEDLLRRSRALLAKLEGK